MKWHILRQKLEITLKNSTKIIEGCARIHNYADSSEDEPEIHAMPGSPLGWGIFQQSQICIVCLESRSLKIWCCVKSPEKDHAGTHGTILRGG
jgi:hypothetical protein